MRNNANGGNTDIVLSDIIEKLPFWNRVVYIGMIVCWVNSVVNIVPVEYVACHVPKSQIFSIFWTVFTSAFYVGNLIKLVMIITNLSTFMNKLERRTSTPFFILKFFGIHILITLITLIIDGLIYKIQEEKSSQAHFCGIEGIWFNLLYKFCALNSNKDIKFLCFQWKFKRAYYPFILMALYCTFSFSINIIVGIAIAVLQIKYEEWYLSYLSGCYSFIAEKINFNLEYGWINYNSNFSKFVSQKITYENIEDNLEQFQPLATSDRKAQGNYFSNKKGVRIG